MATRSSATPCRNPLLIGLCLAAVSIFFPAPLLSQGEGGPERQRVNSLKDEVRALDRTTRQGELQHARRTGEFSIEDILKDDYKKSLQDVVKIQKLAESLRADLEKNDPHVLNVSSMKMTEEIEKLAKKLRSRLKRF